MQLKQPGFGLLEVIIALGIMVFLISMVATFARQDSTARDLKKIEHAVSSMLTTGSQEALVQHRVVRLHIKSEASNIQSIQLEQEDKTSEEKNKFSPAHSVGGTNFFKFPATWKIKAIYQGAEDIFNKTTKGTKSVFCPIIPGGIIPALLLHLEATQAKEVATLRTEPFQKTISLHNSLLAPPKKVRT